MSINKERENKTDDNQKRLWTRLPAVFGGAFVSCFLWGSAFPCIKVGYALFRVEAADTASQMLFAGLRFMLAGVLVILFMSLLERRPLRPKRESAGSVVVLALLQTAGQYFFFYIGLAHASGVNASIITGSGTFITILIAVFLFRTERMTVRKILGTLVGFAGVLLVEVQGGAGISIHFSLLGEGCILLSAVMAAFSSSFIKRAGRNEDPAALSGYQFVIGGVMLTAVGILGGGSLTMPEQAWKGVLLLLYMALISAAAYTIWSNLLKYNPVSRVAVFGFMNPVIGVLLSALVLGEARQAFRLASLGALALVSAGIVIVNYRGNARMTGGSNHKPGAENQAALFYDQRLTHARILYTRVLEGTVIELVLGIR